MLSIDTNLLLYALNESCDEYDAAASFVAKHHHATDVAIADYVLVELYLLLRNPKVVSRPLSARDAAIRCLRYRTNPSWQTIECEAVMGNLWEKLARSRSESPRRRIIDLRLGLTLVAAGVTRFATRNVRDFKGLGFKEVFDPLA